MDKVGIVVKIFLNVIRFLCKNGKGAVKILQGILWRFQQGLAVREALRPVEYGQEGKRDVDFFPALVVEQNLFNTEKYEITSIYNRFYAAEER